jgi:hypothetical protein
MNSKQKVNDKCLCGSGLKYKKCCKNNKDLYNDIKVLDTHKYIPPKTIIQSIARNTLDILMENIKEPHCKICGDTEKDGKIVKVPTQIGDIYFCEFCYNVQIKM